MGFGVVYNNYKGLGYEFALGTSGSLSYGAYGVGGGLNAAANIKVSSQDGVDFTMGAGLGVSASYGIVGASANMGVSMTVNSRNGETFKGYNSSVGGTVGPVSTAKGQEVNLIPQSAYVPNLQFGTTSYGLAGDIHVGGQIPFCWCNVYGYTSASYSSQKLQSNNVTSKAFGYLNMQNSDKNSAMDFNRDKDGAYYLECPKLPAAALTFDYFNANAQGLSLPFRSYRNDVGTVFDNEVNSNSSNQAFGLEVSFGGYFGLGGNYNKMNQTSRSGVWNTSPNTTGVANFKATQNNQVLEAHHFKGLNEMNFSDDANFDTQIGNDNLVKFKQLNLGSSGPLINVLQGATGSLLNASSLQRQKRLPRTDNISYLTEMEAEVAAVDKQLNIYNEITTGATQSSIKNILNPFNSSSNPTGYQSMSRNLGGIANSNHISEVSITKDDGARYIFGMPVYNRIQKEAVFNVSAITSNSGGPAPAQTIDTDLSLVHYTPGTDNAYSTTGNNGNTRGINNYYQQKTVNGYASSFLLTELLSSDYVDVDENGPTKNDLGNYVKFNYFSPTISTGNPYEWRVPFEFQKALYQPNLQADNYDDLGSYVYGQKDLYYVNSIVTKNYVAVFYTSNRMDFKGANVSGGVSSSSPLPRQLDKIEIYSLEDGKTNYSTGTATPLKVVHFEYDYSLCPGTKNSTAPATSVTPLGQGKLTLRKIYFTYGNSAKGVYNSYQFNYADFNDDGNTDSGLNPTYNHANMDRWGTFQRLDQTDPTTAVWASGQTYFNEEFSYTVQDKNRADNNARAWQLSTIITPAGSKIRVQYEADDYGYVQDKQATQMALLTGASSSPSGFGTVLYDPSSSPFTPHLYLRVDISMFNGGIPSPGTLPTDVSNANNILRNNMLPADGNLYFNAFVQLGSDGTTFEHIPGYSQIESGNCMVDVSSFSGGFFKTAIIKLAAQDIDDAIVTAGDNVNPISKAAWQMTRLYLPRIAYPGSEPANPSPSGSSSPFLAGLAALAGSLTEVLTFNQKNGRLRLKGYSSNFQPRLSFIRLTNPNKIKIGGGHRVKQITIQDGWNSMTSASEATSIYGQTYDYTIQENNATISSGVASYEPLIGGDENSNRTVLAGYSVPHALAPNDQHFVENPIGEPFYPAPLVGYRQVKVRNIDHFLNDPQVYVSSTPQVPGASAGKPSGFTVYEFFTAKDFPITSGMTGIDLVNYKPNPSVGLFNNYLEYDVFVNQGLILKLNNMHGKPKSAHTFQEGQSNPISGIEYTYLTDPANTNQLSNTVPVIGSDNNITQQLMGRNIEAVTDLRQQTTSTFVNQYMGNLNVSPFLFGITLPIPSYFQGTTTDIRTFQASVFTKIVTQQGILQSVETINDYVHTTATNLLWDKNTGEVLVSQSTNEFNDPIFSFGYPAYWSYQGMGPAFQNIGFTLAGNSTSAPIDFNTGIVTPGTAPIQPGDEVLLTVNQGSSSSQWPQRVWVTYDLGSGNYFLVNRFGEKMTAANLALTGVTGFTIKVVRSGFRNMQTIPTGHIASLANFIPASGLGALILNPSITGIKTGVIDANATEFSEYRFPYCYSGNYEKFGIGKLCGLPTSTNPYILGELGNWFPKTHYTNLVNRDQNVTGEFNIRKDGTYDSFVPFWFFNSSSWLPVYNASRPGINLSKPLDNWFISSDVTKVNINGLVVESRDDVNRYSSTLDGYNHTLRKAAAVNAKYRQIGYDGFEDYDYTTGTNPDCSPNHFEFYAYKNTNLSQDQAHTGRYSLKLAYSQTASLIKYLNDTDQCATAFPLVSGNGILNPSLPGLYAVTYNPSNIPIYTPQQECDCIPEFSPVSNSTYSQNYVLSFWIKETNYPTSGSYSHGSAGITLNYSGGGSLPISPTIEKSKVIDGWQKYDYYFTIPASTSGTPILSGSTISFDLQNSSGSGLSGNYVYFDDVRIHPFNATMQSVVYDPISLRVWATLDDRNYATFYEYDTEGTLVRTKKETETGIRTIQEKRHSLIKLAN